MKRLARSLLFLVIELGISVQIPYHGETVGKHNFGDITL